MPTLEETKRIQLTQRTALLTEQINSVANDLQSRTAASSSQHVDLGYFSAQRRSSWDLSKDGVEHLILGNSMWIDRLIPNGTSPSYYWFKEEKFGWYFAFARNSNIGGKFDVLVSFDDVTYNFFAQDADKLVVVK